MDVKELCFTAIEAMNQAYAPYSSFRVGAALLTQDGKIYTGCNIENASFGATICAERVALHNAVSNGEQEFVMLAIAGGIDGKVEKEIPPCGICRQAFAEFCKPTMPVVLVTNMQGEYTTYTLGELLPKSFSFKE